MRDVLNIINQIASTSSRNDKERILQENKDNQLLKDVLHFVYNPFILTGLSDKKIKKKVKEQSEYIVSGISGLMSYLSIYNTGTDRDIAIVQEYISNQPEELQDFIKQIVTKSLKIGATESTLNKVFGKGFIPSFGCMLAKKFDDHKNKIKGDFVITKKLDGNRLLVVKENGVVKSFTRTGNQYEGLEQIESEIKNLDIDNIVFDGELIADAEGTTQEVYAETTSKARKKGSNKTGLIFHIFDILPIDEFKNGESKGKCVKRKLKLSELLWQSELKYCKEVQPLYIGSDVSRIKDFLDIARENGWEGIMVNLDSPYVCKRTDQILKVKVFSDADVKVLDVIEGTGKNVGKLGAITIQFEHEGQLYECNCGSGFSDSERELYWIHPELIVGKIVTIGYFEISKNDQGSYGLRFPTWKGIIREDKTEISMN